MNSNVGEVETGRPLGRIGRSSDLIPPLWRVLNRPHSRERSNSLKSNDLKELFLQRSRY